MFLVISHTPTDDINCPSIDPGPVGETREQAIERWKELRIADYLASGLKDEDWDPTQPDSTEGRIYDMAAELLSDPAAPLPHYVNGGDEQAYLVQLPLPEAA